MIGFLPDAKLRKAAGRAKSLDDVMRLAYERHSGPKGYTPERFRAVAAEVAGADLSAWFHDVLDTTKEMDYKEALDFFGLRFQAPPQRPGSNRIQTGIQTNNTNGRIVVTGLPRGMTGYGSGLNTDDEILAVNGYRVRAEQWPLRLEDYQPGGTVELLVARRDHLTTLKLLLGSAQREEWTFEVRPDSTPEQKQRLKDWLRL